MGVIVARGKNSHVLFGGGEFCGQRDFGDYRRHHVDEGEAQARIAICVAADTIRHSSIHRGICLVGIGRDAFPYGYARHGRGVHAVCAGAAPFFAAAKRAAVRAERDEPQPDGAVPGARRSNDALYCRRRQ